MPELYPSPVRIPAPGGKVIEEHIGAASNAESRVSVAHMTAPAGWSEPFQTPEFDEFTIVLSGTVLIDHDGGQLAVGAGQSVKTAAGERIRYSCGPDGASYIAVCLPAFTPETVNRDA
ncbi:hypothetical protein ATK17_2249 [Branchiibius hedensis]|uniref:Mannose-6-phosphate isomerase, cupin superfamily n=1 Tax=Branchiibius hedensis TaxID=672460 RepID=A0A2Y8ZYD5_9MICO|nr:cupin [Branchiibius hedensis]PWJ26105.1 hypothetical protein ATK17_2249 [Branchiibius hedensis]SSA34917.1 hypothetical protein SAMN04489750_2249 [Branchiibius hedensis]